MFLPAVEAFMVYGLFLLIMVTVVFLIAQFKSDNSLMDIAYGPIFLATSFATIYFYSGASLLTYLITGLTALWSLRLGLRIYRKNKGLPEDARYAKWRLEWQEKGSIYFVIRSYLQINLLQGLVILIVSLPFIISIGTQNIANNLPLKVSIVAGVLVFLIGLLIEGLADYQLDRFIANKKAGIEKANLMRIGLFRYSRRPNYFGETLIWWGMSILVLSLPLGYLALLSPILITYIVTKVTGPMLEDIFLAKYGDEYREYMKTTSYFIPLRPKSLHE